MRRRRSVQQGKVKKRVAAIVHAVDITALQASRAKAIDQRFSRQGNPPVIVGGL